MCLAEVHEMRMKGFKEFDPGSTYVKPRAVAMCTVFWTLRELDLIYVVRIEHVPRNEHLWCTGT